jgi:hypothetical protein
LQIRGGWLDIPDLLLAISPPIRSSCSEKVSRRMKVSSSRHFVQRGRHEFPEIGFDLVDEETLPAELPVNRTGVCIYILPYGLDDGRHLVEKVSWALLDLINDQAFTVARCTTTYMCGGLRLSRCQREQDEANT